MMRRALSLAERGLYTTTPNPRVGCVVTRGEAIVGEGWHERAGGPHAEVLARRGGHRWRARACAILTGIGTVRADDPQLTVREVDTPRQPLRIIVDSRLETPRDARILRGERVLVFAGREGALPNAEVITLPN